MTPTKDTPNTKSRAGKPGTQDQRATKRTAPPTSMPVIEAVHVDALMGIIHRLTNAGTERPTNDLDVRQRLVVQTLGLDEPQSIASIGSTLGLSASTMTRIIDRLEQLKVLDRKPHPSDRRVTIVQLTKQGREIFEQERAFYGSILEATVSGLDDHSTSDVLNALAALTNITTIGQEASS